MNPKSNHTMAVLVNNSEWVTGAAPSLPGSRAPDPRQGRCAACSARKLAPPLRVTGPLRGRGDELGTKRSPLCPLLAHGPGQGHALAVSHRLWFTSSVGLTLLIGTASARPR